MAKAAKSSAKPTTNVFGSAPPASNAKPAANGAVEVPLPGLDNSAALRAVIDALTAILTEEDRLLKVKIEERVITVGMAMQSQPPNFKGVDNISSASCQIRAKSAGLTEADQLLMEEHGIQTVTETKVAGTFIINPAYAVDPKFVADLEDRCGVQLTEMADERGSVIMKQEAVEVVKITDQGRSNVFTKSEAVIRTLLPVAFTTAIRAKLETEGELAPAIELVEKLFGTELFAKAAKSTQKKAA